jgi:acyl-coenzyme A thioesterase 13
MKMNPVLQFLKDNVGKSLSNGPSPIAKWLDGTLTAAEEGSLTATFTVRQEMCNPMMILNGGVMATMMDDLMGITVYSLGGENFYTSINLSIDFLKSARIGETVTAVSQVIRQGRNVVNCDCKVYNEKQELLAKAMSNLIQTNVKV